MELVVAKARLVGCSAVCSFRFGFCIPRYPRGGQSETVICAAIADNAPTPFTLMHAALPLRLGIEGVVLKKLF